MTRHINLNYRSLTQMVILAAVLLLATSQVVFSKGTIKVLETAIEGAQFPTYRVNPNGYGYAIVKNCIDCSSAGISLGIDPNTRVFINNLERHITNFEPSNEGMTTVFFDKASKMIIQIRQNY
ncbi:MAG: hypothetical protein DHS20C01_26980 [marine bacterium B5-7]|nr:MAG: hypothetical protein DHS20C01_26980 [marine bacterium B5-7]